MQHIAAETVNEMRKRRAKRQMEGKQGSSQKGNEMVDVDEDEEDEKWNKPL